MPESRLRSLIFSTDYGNKLCYTFVYNACYCFLPWSGETLDYYLIVCASKNIQDCSEKSCPLELTTNLVSSKELGFRVPFNQCLFHTILLTLNASCFSTKNSQSWTICTLSMKVHSTPHSDPYQYKRFSFLFLA